MAEKKPEMPKDAAECALPDLDSLAQLELDGFINNATQLAVKNRQGKRMCSDGGGLRAISLLEEYESGISHGRGEYYQDLCQKPFYANNHTNYVCYDRVIGPVCVTVAEAVLNERVGIVRTCLGFQRLTITASDKQTDWGHTVRRQLAKQTKAAECLGLMLAKYFNNVSPLVQAALITSFSATNRLGSGDDTFDETYAAKLADSLEICQEETLQTALFDVECIKYKRSFLYDIVLSGSSEPSSQKVFGRFLGMLGEPFKDFTTNAVARSSSINSVRSFGSHSSKSSSSSRNSARKPSLGGRDHYAAEFLATERSYVRKLNWLVQGYARPLRSLATSRTKAVLPRFEAANIFGNIEEILKVNTAFLEALEKIGDESKTIGSVCVEFASRFEVYRPYLQAHADAEQLSVNEEKRSKTYREFLEKRKYDAAAKDRLGIRELLVEPVQRLPRYNLMLGEILEYLPENDPDRPKILNAMAIVNSIAMVKEDDNEKLAHAYFNMTYSIERFPANMISQTRHLLHCLDVEEHETGERGTMPVYSTILLFDDKLVLLRRTNGSVDGPRAAGIDDAKKIPLSTYNATRTTPASPQKKQLIFRAVVDVTDCNVSDISIDSFHLDIEASGEPPVRSGNTYHVKRQAEKSKFLDKFNQARALVRTKDERSTAYRFRYARLDIYFNVFTREQYAKETNKRPIALVFGETEDMEGFDGLFQEEKPAIVGLMEPEERRLCLSLRSRPDFEGISSTVGTLVIPETKLLVTVMNELLACELALEEVAPLAVARSEEDRHALEQALRPHLRNMPRLPLSMAPPPIFDLYSNNSSTSSPVVEKLGNLFRKPTGGGSFFSASRTGGPPSPIKRTQSISSLGRRSNDSLSTKHNRWL